MAETIDFQKLAAYAARAQMAYESAASIQAAYPATVRIATPGGREVLYFLEQFPDEQRQLLTVRGTANRANVLQDLEYLRIEDSELGIPVHRGFDTDAKALLADLRPHLRAEYDIHITGHSLGAAVGTLLMMYLQREGYRASESVNFGQPKITNERGAEAFEALDLLRVVDGNDLVPLLPAATLLDCIGGLYTHFGREVTLLDGPHYSYLDQPEAMSSSRGDFWKDLGEESVKAHSIDRYCVRIEAKLSSSKAVPFAQRESFLGPHADD